MISFSRSAFHKALQNIGETVSFMVTLLFTKSLIKTPVESKGKTKLSIPFVSNNKLFFMETVLLRLEMISILGRGKKL